MKNPNRVAELLAELNAECECRFEFEAVAKLASTIGETPRVKILDDDHQLFRGKIYNKTPSGHFKKGNYLHLDVWSSYYGKPPKGYVIHHIDFNPANNNIENLRCLTALEHRKIHVPEGNQISKPLKDFVCETCGQVYQAFDTGNNHFCSNKCRYKKKYHEQSKIEQICPVCGKHFSTRKKSPATTCSRSCANKWRWHHSKSVER